MQRKYVKSLSAILVALLLTISQVAIAAKVVFDPWNRVENAATVKKLIEQVGLSMDQLRELEQQVRLSIDILAEATWIHDAVTGEWDLGEEAKKWLNDQIEFEVAHFVPPTYRDLVEAILNHEVLDYLRQRRSRYPTLEVEMRDPYSKDSHMSYFYKDAQDAYDASHAIAEQTFDRVPQHMQTLEMLHNSLPQPDVNSTMTVLSEIQIQNGLEQARINRANAIHNKAWAQERSAEIERRRAWMEFMSDSLPDPSTLESEK